MSGSVTLEGVPPALRLGLRMVKGLSCAGGERITAARPFRDIQDLARRARLNRRDLEALAAADALRGLCGNRHQARWQVLGIEAPLPPGDIPEPVPMLRRPTEGEGIVADYGSLGLTLRRHPLSSPASGRARKAKPSNDPRRRPHLRARQHLLPT